ncbi:hypothetical protein HY487_01750, partial [Candidatus Woesearchaeota archaeon]|nr:hypothetical protein [Candidatus Woesearchaeota archaeon]
MNTRKKMDILKGSLESGAIGKEEYEKSKGKLEPGLKEFDMKVEEINKEEPEAPKSSEKSLIIAVSFIVLLLAAIFAFSIFYKQQPKTLEDLHVLNLQGKLKPEQGYVYKGAYSFVTLEGLWYT